MRRIHQIEPLVAHSLQSAVTQPQKCTMMRTSSLRTLSSLTCSLLMLVVSASSAKGASIEDMMNALQVRYHWVAGYYQGLPDGPNGEAAPAILPAGFYASPSNGGGSSNSTADAAGRAKLVRALILQLNGVTNRFLDTTSGSMEGRATILPYYQSQNTLDVTAVDAINYSAYLVHIPDLIDNLRYISRDAWAGSSGMKQSDFAYAAQNGFTFQTAFTPDAAWTQADAVYGVSANQTYQGYNGPIFDGEPIQIEVANIAVASGTPTNYNAYLRNCNQFLYLQSPVPGGTGSGTCYLKLDYYGGGSPGTHDPGSAPVAVDKHYHAWQSAGPTSWTSTTLGSAKPAKPKGGPAPTAYLGYSIIGATIIYDGQFPTFNEPAPPGKATYNGPCPICPTDAAPGPANPMRASGVGGSTTSVPGTSSDGNSIVDNILLIHHHVATDYGMMDGQGGCTTCGSRSSPDGGLPALCLQRIHRYADQDMRGSFGPGVFSSYDIYLTLCSSTQTIELWDPRNRFALDLTDASSTGLYNDVNHQLIQELRLYDTSHTQTASQVTARTATLTTWTGETFTFELFSTEAVGSGNQNGRLTRYADRNGNAITFTYQDTNPQASDATLSYDRGRLWRLASIVDAYGHTATFAYVLSAGQWVISAIALPNATSVAYRYDTGQLVGVDRVDFPDGTSSTFSTAWDATDQVQTVTLDDAAALDIHRRKTLWLTASSVTVDPMWPAVPQSPNRIRQVINGSGEISYQNTVVDTGVSRSVYVYEGGGTGGQGQMLRLETQAGVPVSLFKATAFNMAQPRSTYAWQKIADYQLDQQSRLQQTSDAVGRQGNQICVPSGAITQRTLAEADGTTFSQETTTYNAFRQPLVHTDTLSHVTECTYDAAGNMLTRVVARGTPAQATWSWTYNARGQVQTATDANTNVTTYTYNEVSTSSDYKQLVSITEPADRAGDTPAVRQFHYDTVGRLATTTDASGRLVTYQYDLRNRPSTILYADSSQESWTYGTTAAGTANLVATHTDRNGNKETFSYDSTGRKAGLTIAGPDLVVVGTRSWTYLTGKQLVTSETVDGKTTSFAYDTQLRQVAVTRQPRSGVSLVEQTVYDGDQRVAYTSDAYGRRTFFAYDRNDMPVRTVRELTVGALAAPPVSDQLTAFITYLARDPSNNPGYVIEDAAYDTEAQRRSATDGRGILSSFTLDEQGRLTALVDGDTDTTTTPATFLAIAGETAYGYDPQGNRTSVTRPRSFARNPDGSFTLQAQVYQTVMSYTGRNLLASVTEASGSSDAATVTYTYTPTGKRASETDPRNPAWLTLYRYFPCCDRLKEVEDPLHYLTSFTYDSSGNQTSVSDANGNGRLTQYDARNRPKLVTNTENEATTIQYDDNLTDGVGLDATYAAQLGGLNLAAGSAGSAVAVTNAVGETAVEVRDGMGRVVRRIDGNRNYRSMGYDTVVSGLVETAATDALGMSSATGHVVRSRADARGSVRQTVDQEGHLSQVAYDAAGNAVIAADPNGIGWSATYDARNRMLTRLDTHGDQVGSTYDLDGNVTVATDALLHQTVSTYDFRDRKKTVLDRVGGLTTYGYDFANHLLTIQDADSAVNGVTTYTYDARGQLATETFPQGIDSHATQRTYTYDPGRRLGSRTVAESPVTAASEATTYGYDHANRLTGRVYADALNDVFAYDHAGRLTSATSNRYGVVTVRAYTENSEAGGRLTSERMTIDGVTYPVLFGYDAADRKTAITYPDGSVVGRSYSERNLLTGVTFAGSSIASSPVAYDGSGVPTSSAYDAGGRLLTTTLGNGKTETRAYRADDNQLTAISVPSVTGFSYTYDGNKRKTGEGNSVLTDQAQTFGAYDDENRLTSWARSNGDTQTWTLSKVGDWQSTVINGTGQSRSHDAVHEVTAIGASPLGYDFKGNLTLNVSGAVYGWDPENRLSSATVSDATSGASDVARYRYDALGRRVQKTVYGISTTFIHDGAQVVHEFDAPQQLPATASTDDGTGTGTPPGGGILQGAGVTRINAQPSLSAIPSGFFADKGKTLAARSNGKSYGWDTAETANAMARHQHPLPQFDTFIQFGTAAGQSTGTWKITSLTPSTTYAVVVVMGDAASTNQTDDITIQGLVETDATPAQVTPPDYHRGNFDGYAETVTVAANGTLTIAARATAVNPKLCFVEIGAPGSAITQADRDRLTAAIKSANDATGMPAFPKAQPTPRLYAYGSYEDEPLALIEGATKTKYYYAKNHLYSVAALTDASGAVVERYKYDAYGRQGILAGNGVVSYTPSDYGQFVGFTGRYGDWESNLIYFRYRYSDPQLGRFMSRDPWRAGKNPNGGDGYPMGFDAYAEYFSPNYKDPTGLKTELAFNVIGNSLGFADTFWENHYTNDGMPINIPTDLPAGKTPADYVAGRISDVVNWFGGKESSCVKYIRLSGHGAGAGIDGTNGSISNLSPAGTLEQLRPLMCPDAEIKIFSCGGGNWPGAMLDLGRRMGAAKVCGCPGPVVGNDCQAGWKCVNVK